jgi:hypothetical protein
MELEDCETSLVETTFIKPSETGSIRAVTVYQALRSEHLHGDAEFTLDGVKFSKVRPLIRMCLRSSNTRSEILNVTEIHKGPARHPCHGILGYK